MKIITDEMLKFVGKQESQFIGKASDWKDQVKSRLNGELKLQGDLLPWGKTHTHVSLRPGEVSLWGGFSGHRKSLLLGQVCAWGLNKKWLIASLEMKPEATLERMVKQVAGSSIPSDEITERWLDWTDNRLWIYDQTDSVEPERIIGLTHYAAELGVNHVVIDCLIKCGIGRDDYEKQAQFVDRLCWSAKANNIHIHLVHHMRKGDEKVVPSKYDFRGAGEVVDYVDNVFIIHATQEDAVFSDGRDATIKVDKQRHGEWEGVFKFWFNQNSMQLVSDEHRVMEYKLLSMAQ